MLKLFFLNSSLIEFFLKTGLKLHYSATVCFIFNENSEKILFEGILLGIYYNLSLVILTVRRIILPQ